jgi:hypothetical protein
MKANSDCSLMQSNGTDGYVITRQGPQPAHDGLNITFDFRDVGFAPDTLVRVRDLFVQKDLGVFTGGFTGVAVPEHGVQMLRLEYEPKYKAGL